MTDRDTVILVCLFVCFFFAVLSRICSVATQSKSKSNQNVHGFFL